MAKKSKKMTYNLQIGLKSTVDWEIISGSVVQHWQIYYHFYVLYNKLYAILL